MKINEHTTKSFSFSCEDAQIVNSIVLKRFGKTTIKTVLDNDRWYIPMISAYGKIVGAIGMIDHSQIRFSYDEKRTMCEVLQKEWSEEQDPVRKEKIQVLLEGIFNNA